MDNFDKEYEGYKQLVKLEKSCSSFSVFIEKALACPKCGNGKYNRINGLVYCGKCGHRFPLPDGWKMHRSEINHKKNRVFSLSGIISDLHSLLSKLFRGS